MKVFLTGATGYIGGSILRNLMERGHMPVALVRSPAAADRLRSNKVSVCVGDMTLPAAWQGQAAECDAIIHAAQIRFPKRIGRSWVAHAAAADAAAIRALAQSAKSGGKCKAFIYTSGVSVFGDHGDQWIDESSSCRPSDLGQYHLSGEGMVQREIKRGLPGVILRPSLPYAASGTFNQFFLAPAAMGRFNFVGTGMNYCPCVDLGDLGRAYVLAIEAAPIGKTIAVVDDAPMTMRDIGQALLSSFGRRDGKLKGAPVWLAGLFAGMPLARMLSESYRVRNGNLKSLLGWSPKHASLADALPEIIGAYRSAVDNV